MKYKQKKLNNWCKRAQVTMIMNDISIEMLEKRTGYCSQHINAIINGRLKSQPAIDKIADALGISNEYD